MKAWYFLLAAIFSVIMKKIQWGKGKTEKAIFLAPPADKGEHPAETNCHRLQKTSEGGCCG